MKVLHILSSNKFSGAENVACQIIDMFRNDIEMAYCSPKGDIEKELRDRGVKYFSIDKLTYKEVKKVVDEFHPDILHAHDLRACAIVSKFKMKKVAHIHVNHPQMSKIGVRSILAKSILSKFNKIVWVSKSCLEDYVFANRFRNENSLILSNIISLENLNMRAKNAEVQNAHDVVYCGRLCEQKNPLRLVEVCKQLVEKDKEISIGIIGNGDMFEIVSSKIKEYKLDKNVKLYGFVSNPLGAIKNSSVMILTSFFEGTPMTALESMGLGVPVISTKTDGMIDLIEQNINGYLYDTDEECCDEILRLKNHAKELKNLQKTTKDFAQQYNDVEKYKKKILSLYE